jgi:catechol 2,3-dioxygenase-like lactoylglutathione lyase family enzyme
MPSPRPPAFAQQITFLYAEDPAACRDFYGRVLGLELVQDQGSAAIYAAAGHRAFLGVVRARGPRQGHEPRAEGGVVLTLVTPAVEAWHAHLLAEGVAVDAAPAVNAATGITHFFFRDPAGYLLEIQRFDRPDWPHPD